MVAPGPILVVDDEPTVARLVQMKLESEGMTVAVAYSGAAALAMLAEQAFALVILDLLMPEMDGYAVLRRIREQSRIPVLVLTTSKREADGIRALRDWADDFLIKPFDPAELSLRVSLLLRRVYRSGALTPALRYGDVTIEPGVRRVTRAGQDVRLSRTEWEVLLLLIRMLDHVVPHAEVMTAVWGEAHREDGWQLRTWIRRLRGKLGAAVPILNIAGMGYRLEAPEQGGEAQPMAG